MGSAPGSGTATAEVLSPVLENVDQTTEKQRQLDSLNTHLRRINSRTETVNVADTSSPDAKPEPSSTVSFVTIDTSPKQ